MMKITMISFIGRYKHLASVVAIVVLIAGCASQAPVPEDKFYRLQAVTSSAPLSAAKFSGTLEVERFSADGLTAGRPIVYANASAPNQLLEYHYHFWTQPPTVMLRDELVTYLRAAKIADNVVTPEMRLEPEYIMTGRIRKLEQIIASPNATRIELEIAVRRPTTGKLVFLKSYAHEAEQTGGGVTAAVEALNKGLNIIYSDLLADLKGL